MRKLTTLLIAGVVALGLSACDDDEGVGPAPTIDAISVTPQSLELQVGSSAQLAAQVQTSGNANPTITWESSDSDIATVDGDGVVTGVDEGQTTVSATATAGGDSKTAAAQVTVNPAPADVRGVSITPNEFTIAPGQTTQLEATVDAQEGVSTEVTWSSSSTDVATVDSTGTVTGQSSGNVTITATSVADPSKSASASGTVKQVESPEVNIKDVKTLGLSASSAPGEFENETEEERFWAQFFDDEPYENYEFTTMDLNQLEDFEASADPSALYGTVEVTVQFDDPGNQVDEVALWVDSTKVDYQSFSSNSDQQANAAVREITFTLETHALRDTVLQATADSTPSILRPMFMNGDHQLKASAVAGGDTTIASHSQKWNFRNPNLYLSAYSLVGPNVQTAKDVDGLSWERGSVAVAAVPVVYNDGQTVARTKFELTENFGPAATPILTDSTASDGFAVVFSDTVLPSHGGVARFQTHPSSDRHSSIGLTGVDEAGEFITPADLDFTLLRLDNRPPAGGALALKPPFATCGYPDPGDPFAEAVFFDQSVMNDSIPGSLDNWINAEYEFACGATGGSDTGVGLASSVFISGSGDTVETGADFAASGSNDAYSVFFSQTDKLGNTTKSDTIEFGVDKQDPTLAARGEAGENEKVGSGTPQDLHRFNTVEGEGDGLDSNEGQEFDPLYNNVDELGRFAWHMEATDQGAAGFGDLDAPFPPGTSTSPDDLALARDGQILFGRLIRRTAGGNACMIGSDNTSASLSDEFCDDVPMRDSLPIGAPGTTVPNGYYFYLATAQDQAGNQSDALSPTKFTLSEETVKRRIIVDDELPAIPGGFSYGTLTGGESIAGAITVEATDNLDLWFYQHALTYTGLEQAASPHENADLNGELNLLYETGAPVSEPDYPGGANERDNVIDAPFDENSEETMNTGATLESTAPIFAATIEQVSDTHAPTLASEQPSSNSFFVQDAAGNNTARADSAIGSDVIEGGGDYTLADFLTWQMTGPQEELTIDVDENDVGQFQIDVTVEAEVAIDNASGSTPFEAVHFLMTPAPSEDPNSEVNTSIFNEDPAEQNPTLFIGEDPDGPDLREEDVDGDGDTDRVFRYKFQWNPTPEQLRAAVGQLPKTDLEQDADIEVRALGIDADGRGVITHALEEAAQDGTVLHLTLKK